MLQKSILFLVSVDFLLGSFYFSMNFEHLSGILLLQNLFISLINISLCSVKPVLNFLRLVPILAQFLLENIAQVDNLFPCALNLTLTLANKSSMLLGNSLQLIDHIHTFANPIINMVNIMLGSFLMACYFVPYGNLQSFYLLSLIR